MCTRSSFEPPISPEICRRSQHSGGRNNSNTPGCDHSWSATRTFWDVTEAALRAAVTQLKIQASDAELHGLMQAYLRPSAFPDVTDALDALKGSPLAILSNGSPKMLDPAVHHNGLTPFFAEIISVDRVRTFKPSPRVYALATEVL